MEENQTSESVAVLSEVSEPLTSETEKASALTGEHEAHAVAVTTNASSVSGVTGVPGVEESLSLLVGSITGVTNSNIVLPASANIEEASEPMADIAQSTDDTTFFDADSPGRSSTPRQRKIEVSDGEAPSYKHESDDSVGANKNDESDNEVVVPDKQVWPQFLLTYELDVQQPQQQDTAMQSVYPTENAGSDDILKKIEIISNKMIDVAIEIQAKLDKAKKLKGSIAESKH